MYAIPQSQKLMLHLLFLIFFSLLGKPLKPDITGDLNIEENRYVELTCYSNSTSAPDYYSNLVNLSYIWFVNDSMINEETSKSITLYVTRNITYNRYSCTAREDDMESDRSNPVQINPLCKYG